MSDPKMQLVDWLDDLCVRFIINLPHEELQSVERICFQIEEAQWFYEDFVRPDNPSLPSMNLRKFALLMFQHCPLSSSFSELHHLQAYNDFLAYKTRVPVRGAIMLNEDMTHAVLVKGWKKGAKWSFPRGKINKDEADLDCAVREVYEETGYDLKEANLVGLEEQMKKIPVNMREQSMLLYVFRGVPMDTHFEPRTRKEISKIDWYKLTDLPTLKRKNQAQQGAGQDLVKENNFYMVAPFLGPLKSWIKWQHKLDRQKAKAGAHLAPPVGAGVTDTEELEVDLGETTADEAPILEAQPTDASFADLVAKLGRSHRASDALPEVSAQPQSQQEPDLAAELKNLLGVGSGMPLQNLPVEAPAPAQQPQTNPLLAMLQGNSNPPGPPEPIPRTPFEQILPSPAQPHSPHGQHHPRPPHLDHMPPPPAFPFQPQQNLPFPGPPHPHMPPQHHNGLPMPNALQFMPPPSRQPNPHFPVHAQSIQQAFSHQAPRPYQKTGDPQFAQGPQFTGAHGPAIPPASKLPPPKLNAHTLGLLNAFKTHEKPAAEPLQQLPLHPHQPPQKTPDVQPPPAPHQMYNSYTSPQGVPANPYVPSPPPFQSPPVSANFQPVQPKPRSAHQDSLLNIFRSGSVPGVAATPPPQRSSEEPAELSAYPHTPGHARAVSTSREPGPPAPDMNNKPSLLDAFSVQQKKAGLTSATVSGPVNAPDFDTMKKNTHHHGANGYGSSRGPSPATTKPTHQKMFVPQQILRRESTTRGPKSPTDVSDTVRNPSPKTSTSNMTTPQQPTFKPQILKRPQQSASPAPAGAPNAHAQGLLDMFKSATSPQPAPAAPAQFPPTPAAQTTFDRRETLPMDQKNALLSLFSKPSQAAGSPVQTSKSPLPSHGLPQPPVGLPSLTSKSPGPTSPVPLARSPQPPTPKTLMSGVISPVSPLPEKGSQASPADLASRSRISSIGDVSAPSIVIPQNNIPTSHPATAVTQKNGIGSGTEEGYTSAGSTSLGELSAGGKGKGKANADGKSPVDKTFLLGFLEDVARRGR